MVMRYYGNALLLKGGSAEIRCHDISRPGREPRGAIEARLTLAGEPWRIFATHLGLSPRERRWQVKCLLREIRRDEAINTVLIATLGIGAQWLAWRIKLPAIILLIVAGLLAGWIKPSEDLGNLLHPLIAVSVAIILFEGGLNLRLHEYRETGVDVKRLVTVGLVLTWALGSIAATVVLHGLSIGLVSRRLGLAVGKTDGLLIVGASPWSVGLARALQDLEIPTIVSDAGWNHLRVARMSGLRTHHGHILSERAEQTLEMHEVSHLLAATNNEAYNALVCTRFAPELGRDKVYQLPYLADDEEAGEMARTVRGKIVLGDEHTYDDLMRRHYAGWAFHQTRLTQDYGYKDCLARAASEAIPVALVTSKKRLDLFPLHDIEDIGEGDVIISYQKGEVSPEGKSMAG